MIFAGDLQGPQGGKTVATAHTVREGARTRTYVLVHGLLNHAGPDVVPGAKLEAGAPLGFARAGLGGGLIEVYLEARELREGATLAGAQDAGADAADSRVLTDAARTVPTDVRNVLPLRD